MKNIMGAAKISFANLEKAIYNSLIQTVCKLFGYMHHFDFAYHLYGAFHLVLLTYFDTPCGRQPWGVKGENMREITRIITVQITDIAKIDDDFDIAENRERVKKTCGGVIKELIGVDDAVIVDIQDFVRDIEG